MKKTLAGIFLIIGTTVGAGMLSLPLVTAACGLGATIVLLCLSWSMMYVMAIRLLRLCEAYPAGVNFTTLIEDKMPRVMQLLFTLVYLLLLYSLMSAYTTQGASFVSSLTHHHSKSTAVNAILFILVFGVIIANLVFSDYVNRFFLSVKFIFLILSLCLMARFLQWHYAIALPLSFSALVFAWPTLLPAFGFQNIVPVLYEYQNQDVRAIKRSILLGSLIVLFFYLLWVGACLAILPQQGLHSYQTIDAHGNTLNHFMGVVKNAVHSIWIQRFLMVFINVSVITSFICSGISLFHYIKDIFARFNCRMPDVLIWGLTFLPPFLFTICYPKGFILALQYASIFAVLVFVYTPIFLDRKPLLTKKNLYPIALGSLVILAQVLNLAGITRAF